MADSGYIIDATAVSGDVTSSTIDLRFKRAMSFVYSWTGTLVGTLSLKCRNHSGQTWTPVNLAVFPAHPAGLAGKDEVSFIEAEANYYQVVFTYGSGSGNLQVYCQAKEGSS